MKFSKFGNSFSGDSAIVSLMEDLGTALRVNPEMLFMGGGNPALIPEAESIFRNILQDIYTNQKDTSQMLGVYQPPQGDPDLLSELAAYLKKECDWPIAEKNIALVNGSQTAFFILFNLFAGEFPDGDFKKVMLPLVPEYVGYADAGLSKDFFVSERPLIDPVDNMTFKYRVDFDHLKVDETVGMICCSRPTNPTGNVLTDREVTHLDALARQFDIPFVMDVAYGAPFPEIVYTEAQSYWSDNTILVMSLSKLGLPGARTGFVVAREDVIEAVTRANTVLSLACGNLGPTMFKYLLQQNKVRHLSRNVIRPYYQNSKEQVVRWVQEIFKDLPCAMHAPEGAFFLWLWFKGLPITSEELYQRLKNRNLVVLSGEHFFIGLKDDWPHRHECIRLTYCQSPEVVRRGLELIAEEVLKAFSQ